MPVGKKLVLSAVDKRNLSPNQLETDCSDRALSITLVAETQRLAWLAI